MTRIAFFDIDGTMVNVPNGMMHPTRKTRAALKQFQSAGNFIVVATARNQIPESVRDIDFDGYICSDGHYIQFQNQILLDNLFSDAEIAMQVQLCAGHHGACMLGGYRGNWVSSHSDPCLKRHHAIYFGSDDLSYLPLTSASPEPIEANMLTAVFSDAADMFAARDKLPANWAIHAYGDDVDIRMDVHREGFSKGSACEYLFQHLAIPREHTFAFGDGQNDIEMLQLVGTGIAMGNASDTVKQHADRITGTVDEDGIALAFTSLFNIG